ncbi:MAG: YidB family protein [Xanthobacteraceae bacterium]|jgi:uncharacterized protein YidB (DUF937 family)
MGLMDVLNGMQNGPHGQRGPAPSGGGMSPITMAVLGLIAYKALKSFTSQPSSAPAGSRAPAPSQGPSPGGVGGGLGGGLGNILASGLGGLLAGGAAGSVLSGGLNDLLKQFTEAGHGETAKSWIGSGPNQAVSTDDLAKALGADQINTLMTQTGLSQQDLLAGLSQHLPEVVDQLTPDGRLPTEQELSRSL